MTLRFSYEWNPRPKIHLAIAVSIALFTGLLSFYLYFDTIKNLSASTVTKGLVVESKISASGMHTPIITFQRGEGETEQFVSSLSSSPQKYFIGDTVDVIVSEETGKPRLLNFFSIYGLTSFAALFSTVCWLGSLSIYFLRVRNA
ncbi:DUF3592 domain-containing protein [Ferrimonas sp. SCSIO 43195]|uniref:DUF3592 domain-containing protein n=1 Tax=Ferrimonas sp. SCSIO 43195 TaxID=2822844 RepID=UPI002075E865|nr:DUF3592 domain-containing protein [Ferrimonas sp. SCSIO 43195]USD35836.1 hypothetical protein J8Z22_12355 [Ferrimonas sp. SCSIO 43195]